MDSYLIYRDNVIILKKVNNFIIILCEVIFMSLEEEHDKELEKLDAEIIKEMDKEQKKKKKDDKMIKQKKKYTSLQKFRDKSIIGLAIAGAILLLWPRVYFVLRGMSLLFFIIAIFLGILWLLDKFTPDGD